jgi:N-methylhydantoinase B
MSEPIDPIAFEVVKNGLGSIADEMALVIMRSAYSPVVRDSMDYSTALADRDGKVVAQGLTLAVQLGAFPDAMRYVIRDKAESARPGDVYILNDPYGSGGQHLPDIYVIKPIFVDGALEGYACTMAHHSDVGGIAPGSVAIHATEILQEGLCIPLLDLYEEGRPNRTLFRMIEKNTRQPIQVMGDLRAQIAACTVGERGLVDLVRRHGSATMRRYLEALHDQAEAMMRAFIRDLPDGSHRFVDHIDGIGEDPQTLTIAVEVTIAGDEIAIDLAGTSGQVKGAINCPIAMVHSSAYCAIRAITSPDIPNCEGYIRPIRITAPEGTLVNPLPPAACGARGVIGYRVFDAIMGALANVVPERVIAPGEGGPTLFGVGGMHEGRPFVLTEVMVGTWGARAARDGVEGISNPAANLSNQPVELIEAELPLEVVRYGLVPDSGGAGRQRGGLAFERSFRLLAEEAVFTVRADRRAHPPWGLDSADPGAGSRNELIGPNGVRELPTMPMEAVPFRKGDVFRHLSAGGGGYGDPLLREPTLVCEDVLDGKVSPEAARERYGVVVDPRSGALDEAATLALRKELTARRPAPGGGER